MDRRNFLRNAIAATAAGAAVPETSAADSKMIGIQVGAVSFVDEGVEKVLDEFQQDAAINTLFVATFTYGRGIAGRQVRDSPCPITVSRRTTPIPSKAAVTRAPTHSIIATLPSRISAPPTWEISTCWPAFCRAHASAP